jgi:hypothetical protein
MLISAKESVLIVGLFCFSSGINAQQELTPIKTTDLHLGLLASEHRVRAFSAFGEKATIFVLGAGEGPVMFNTGRVLAFAKNSPDPTEIRIGKYAGQAFASAGDWVFMADSAQRGLGHLFNIQTGESRSFSTITGITATALDGTSERLALLDNEPEGSSTISVYDCKSGAVLGSLTLPETSRTSIVSFAGANELLLIDTAGMQVLPLNLNTGENTLTPGAAFTLRGPEIDDSVARSSRTAGPGFRPRLVLAHLPGRNGNQLFFLSPYKIEEGLRLVEFNSSGKQIRSFRVRAENDAAVQALRPTAQLVSASNHTFELAGQDGVIRAYEIPQ